MSAAEPPRALPPRPTGGRAGVPLALAVLAFVAACALSLELSIGALFEPGAARALGGFAAGFVPPAHEAAFLARLARAATETIAMSLVGTALGALLALPLALLSARTPAPRAASRPLRHATGLLLAALRSVPELVWAALLLVVVGIGPASGTLALALHTVGVLGRLHAETLENLPPATAAALRANGASPLAVLAHATLPLALPRLLSWTLYRWESNIRIAALLGVVGAGGLGQMLHVSLSLFRMHEAASVMLATLVLVILVDATSFRLRRTLMR